QAFSVAERQLHGLLLNMRRVVSRIYGALFRGSLGLDAGDAELDDILLRIATRGGIVGVVHCGLLLVYVTPAVTTPA
ncbi:hypothetical protein NY667_20980, partial [Xanthomonas hortorum pv. hederae]